MLPCNVGMGGAPKPCTLVALPLGVLMCCKAQDFLLFLSDAAPRSHWDLLLACTLAAVSLPRVKLRPHSCGARCRVGMWCSVLFASGLYTALAFSPSNDQLDTQTFYTNVSCAPVPWTLP